MPAMTPATSTRHGTRCFVARRRSAKLGVPPASAGIWSLRERPDRDVAAEERRHEQPGQDPGDEELEDRHFRRYGVDDHDHRRRNQDAERARAGERPEVIGFGVPAAASSGNAIRAIVAQVAVEEPETAPNSAQPSTFTWSNDRERASATARAPEHALEILLRNRISPIQMNIGSAASVQSAPSPQIVVASTEPAGMPPPTNWIPAQPTAARPNRNPHARSK